MPTRQACILQKKASPPGHRVFPPLLFGLPALINFTALGGLYCRDCGGVEKPYKVILSVAKNLYLIEFSKLE